MNQLTDNDKRNSFIKAEQNIYEQIHAVTGIMRTLEIPCVPNAELIGCMDAMSLTGEISYFAGKNGRWSDEDLSSYASKMHYDSSQFGAASMMSAVSTKLFAVMPAAGYVKAIDSDIRQARCTYEMALGLHDFLKDTKKETLQFFYEYVEDFGRVALERKLDAADKLMEVHEKELLAVAAKMGWKHIVTQAAAKKMFITLPLTFHYMGNLDWYNKVKDAYFDRRRNIYRDDVANTTIDYYPYDRVQKLMMFKAIMENAPAWCQEQMNQEHCPVVQAFQPNGRLIMTNEVETMRR